MTDSHEVERLSKKVSDRDLREIIAFASDAATWGDNWRWERFKNNATPTFVGNMARELLARRELLNDINRKPTPEGK